MTIVINQYIEEVKVAPQPKELIGWHRASREVLARGVITAAGFLCGRGVLTCACSPILGFADMSAKNLENHVWFHSTTIWFYGSVSLPLMIVGRIHLAV